MPWPFVGRTELLDRIRAVFAEPGPGPVLLVGPPGMGRSTLLAEALARAPLSRDDAVLRLEPAGPAPFASLRGLLPDGFAFTGTPDRAVASVTGEVAARLSGRRPVVAFDDAHLADAYSVRVLRQLRNEHDAIVFATAAGAGALPSGPDPLDCLRYDLGSRTLRLPRLTEDEVAGILAETLGGPVRPASAEALHASTGGNPGLLHDLVVRDGLAAEMSLSGGMYQLSPIFPGGQGRAAGEAVTARLTDAVACAWQRLSLDQTGELCRLAAWHGLGRSVAPVWAMALLLRGETAAARRVLDTHADRSPQAEIARAMVVGLGQRNIAAADAVLAAAASSDVRHRARFLACRAWLLAVTGTPAVVELVDPGEDREAALFSRAAHAVAAGRGASAVSHLRRSLAAAEGLRAEMPWFPPYLTACLIDALLLAGRINEATAEAAEFHAGQRGCGWNVAVAFDSLLAARGADGGNSGEAWDGLAGPDLSPAVPPRRPLP
ncbi:AAA family ATPase [Amycolatopsis dendrobii]|uniref:ATP-binding protein n=1 Tax=Amycolatopsis dendrobii TaxID=2760662 RepID=A0A7W3VZK8_9PSEU|nr:ATP-binding protein [Amycolatopsis dendrobii]MBB1156114.1 ATP-binding protein [Amycolatopsis dendrobii]